MSREFSASIARRRPIFAGVEAGYYSLPAEVVDAHGLVVALDGMRVDSPDVAGPRAALVAAVLDAAKAGSNLPDAKAVLRALDGRRQAEEVAAALNAARDQADALLERELSDFGEEIVVDHLRPAHDRAVESGKAAVATLKAARLEPLAVAYADTSVVALSGDDAVPAARQALIDSRAVYRSVSEARRRLVDLSLGRPQLDGDDLFAWCRNMDEIHGPGWQRRERPAPWPAEGVEFWLWALGGPAQLWCPTPAEQDARFEEVYGEAMQVMANARRAAGGGVYVPA